MDDLRCHVPEHKLQQEPSDLGVRTVSRQAVATGAKAVWLQLGLRSPEARHIAETAGLRYVDDLCVATRAVGLGIRKVPEGA